MAAKRGTTPKKPAPSPAKRPMGRPQYVPTDEARETVRILRAQGMSLPAIAAAIDISEPTLTKHFSLDLEVAVAKTTAEVMKARYRSAMGGSVPAQNKFLELAGAQPARPARQARPPKLGKKEAALAAAEAEPDDESGWDGLLQ